MESDLVINDALTIPGAELGLKTSRSGGPGGQHVNKTNSRVSLSWNIKTSAVLNDRQRSRLLSRLSARLTEDGQIQVHTDTERSQHRNRDIARERLAFLIRQALIVKRPRIPTKVSAAKRRRRLDEKKRRSRIKSFRKKPTDD